MVIGAENAAGTIREWLTANVTGGREVADDYPLIDSGILTSLQTLDLVMFLEDRFGVRVEDEELDETNFASIRAIATLVESKAA